MSEELQAGTYEIQDGKRVLVTPPTRETPGGGARDTDGRPYDAPAPEIPPPPPRGGRRLATVKTDGDD